VISLAALSLASFFALRRTVGNAITQLDRENKRLEALVRSSRRLALATDDSEVTEIALESVLRIADAEAAFVFAGPAAGDQFELIDSRGKRVQEIQKASLAALKQLATQVLSGKKLAFGPLTRGSGDGAKAKRRSGPMSAIAFNCSSEDKSKSIVVVQDSPKGDSSTSAARALSALASLVSIAQQNVDLQIAQKNFFTHITHLVVSALDTHLEYHSDHSIQVARLAVSVGRKLKFDEEKLQRMHFAALLHDIGMLRVPRSMLATPEAIQEHPRAGSEMLLQITLWEHLADVVLYHHEWWDGRGYPTGIAGEDIPLESRIIGLAEAFDSMTNTSSYKLPLSRLDAAQAIRDSSGTQFDPKIAQIFLELLDEGLLEDTLG
jgi:putative nucleotidyltransferase with HDIG domain